MASLGHTTASLRSRQTQDEKPSLYTKTTNLDIASSDAIRGKTGKLYSHTSAASQSTGLGLGIGSQPGSSAASTNVISRKEHRILLALVVIAFFVRFHKLGQPSSVVFDEVHFGGFASKYIHGRFFMDVHPPLAKLLITAAAWLGGFNGDFDFKDIGREYLHGNDTPVPYVMMRGLNALLGVATVPLAYLTLRGLSLRASTATLGAIFVLFDNALTAQSRLILLDSILVFFTALTVYLWVSFCNEEKRAPFSPRWWALLSLTGLSLGAVASSKWVGLFTIATIGVSVIAQLWDHLGNVRQPVRTVARHFCARAICLIGFPMLVYLFTFSIHLALLWRSGEGDPFMSSAFQHTLHGHYMADTFADVALGSTVTIKHLNTQGGYLHSHAAVYPAGSQQQQITLYPHSDENNDWVIVKAPGPEDPAPKLDDKGHPLRPEDEITRFHQEPILYLTHGMEIRLIHKTTDKRLHSHDTNRPPVTESDYQNEVTAYGFEGFGGDANDNFHVEIVAGDKHDPPSSNRVRSLRTNFRLRHTLTGCYLFSHKVTLPDWGFGQQEVTCNKNPTMPNSIWYVETNNHPLLSSSSDAKAKKVDLVNYRRPSFLDRFWELQNVMWETNAGLTERHAYDSRPQTWPLLKRGINFWTKDHRQIYLIGNPIVWWSSFFSILAYLSSRAFMMLRAQRGYGDLKDGRVRFYDQTLGFLALGWALHYLPFFLMNRQLFLHHYLPALYFSILILAVVFDFSTSTLRPRFRLVAMVGMTVVVLAGFVRYTPITYGADWTLQACEKARWRKGWDFNCADFPRNLAEFQTLPPAVQSLEWAQSKGQGSKARPVASHGEAVGENGIGNNVNETQEVVNAGAAQPGGHAFEHVPLGAMQSSAAEAYQHLKDGIRHEVDVVRDKVGLGHTKKKANGGEVDPVKEGKAANPAGLDQHQIEEVMLQGTAEVVKEVQASSTKVAPATEPSSEAKLDAHADQEAHEAADVVAADRVEVGHKDA
ncbi:related to dolichyl-phosphate-mannose-protein mannosyltransferase [Melanopsichium pennsylvanicum]|uniref:Dolichyl-phosphate-mannose--protein mannosyltransferase n=2 Tax=Melanopsichium pennsylvanicum TaxID=63383 RepID=A0AAJ4XUH4_9BASI|nr:related to dolichyl-phosphate-mannose-protein mannosyltransferase [Melanopsichium pennsylvanicum 4]SNX87938.1 related to dolichyl-phosphate-mannose-protein mannosyltransferase [Melanopsichium pennsylvanicum]